MGGRRPMIRNSTSSTSVPATPSLLSPERVARVTIFIPSRSSRSILTPEKWPGTFSLRPTTPMTGMQTKRLY